MAFIFNWPSKPKSIMVYSNVQGRLEKYEVETDDYNLAISEVFRHLKEERRNHGAVLALVNND